MSAYDVVIPRGGLVPQRPAGATLARPRAEIVAVVPSSGCGAGEVDRRQRPARVPGRLRPPRALQRARPHRLGGHSDRQRGARRGRGDGVFDMPLNSTPPPLDGAASTPNSPPRGPLPRGLWALGRACTGQPRPPGGIRQRGVIAFKAFMSNTPDRRVRARRRPHPVRRHGHCRPVGCPSPSTPKKAKLTALSPGPTGRRLHGLAPGDRRVEAIAARDRLRRRRPAAPAHRPRQHRSRRRPRHRSADARRRCDLRNCAHYLS